MEFWKSRGGRARATQTQVSIRYTLTSSYLRDLSTIFPQFYGPQLHLEVRIITQLQKLAKIKFFKVAPQGPFWNYELKP